MAEAQFAEYLEKQGAQMVGEDVDGQTYDFRFRFWLNNQSRMYLIEGCLEMIKKYKLQKGDVIVFARKGDGTLVVGGRPAGPVRPPPTPARPLPSLNPTGLLISDSLADQHCAELPRAR